MFIIFYGFQKYPKSKVFSPKTSARAFTLQKVEKGAFNISLDFSLLKSAYTAVTLTLSIFSCPQGKICWSTPFRKIDGERMSLFHKLGISGKSPGLRKSLGRWGWISRHLPSFAGLDTLLSDMRQYTPWGHSFINNLSFGMCQETYPYRAISIGSVQIDTYLRMMSECSILMDSILREAPLSQNKEFLENF